MWMRSQVSKISRKVKPDRLFSSELGIKIRKVTSPLDRKQAQCTQDNDMYTTSSSDVKHWDLVQSTWTELERLRQQNTLTLDGESLDLASVVAVSRYGVLSQLDQSPDFAARIQRSVDLLDRHLKAGQNIHGM